MATTNIPLPTLDWSNEKKLKAFSGWVDFMTSNFIINNVKERLKHNYILLSTGPKGREIIKNALLAADQKENSEKVFKIFETHMIQKPNKWVEWLEFAPLQQNEDKIGEYLVRPQTKVERCDFNAN